VRMKPQNIAQVGMVCRAAFEGLSSQLPVIRESIVSDALCRQSCSTHTKFERCFPSGSTGRRRAINRVSWSWNVCFFRDWLGRSMSKSVLRSVKLSAGTYARRAGPPA